MERFIFLTSILIISLIHEFESIGAIILVLHAGAVLAFLTVRGEFTRLTWLPGLMIYSVLYLILSVASLLPKSWPELYELSAAFRQCFVIVTFFLYIIFFKRFFKHKTLDSAFFVRLTLLMVLVKGIDLAAFDHKFEIYTYTNDNLLLSFALIGLIFAQQTPLIFGCLALSALAFLSTSAQSILVLFLIPTFSVLHRMQVSSKLILLSFMSALFLLSAALMIFPAEAFQIDPNSGVRGVLMNDALEAIVDTKGIGVGFGTEMVRNYFWDIGLQSWGLSGYGGEGNLYLSSHSAYIDLAFRIGIIGCLAVVSKLVFFIWNAKFTTLGMILWAMFLVSFAVNPSLASPHFSFGLSLLLGVLIAGLPEIEQSNLKRAQ